MKKTLFILIFAVICFFIKAQTYDPLAVQRINDLIANNGLAATPNAPETWSFALWNTESPKKILLLNLDNKNLTGNASFEGLNTLITLNCASNNLTKLDLKNCSGLQWLYSSYNKLSELILTNCTALHGLQCHNNNLTSINLMNCSALNALQCNNNNLTSIDLSGLNNLSSFIGHSQSKTLILAGISNGEYIHAISLNNPVFGNSAISYENGILKSTDNTVSSSSFTVQTNKTGFVLSGTMYFEYSNHDHLAIQRINDLIANNGLDATPNAPETWDFAVWNNETPKKIIELNLGFKNLTGAANFNGLNTLQKLYCPGNRLTGLDASDCINLQDLSCGINKLTELDISNCTQLQELWCWSNNLTELDVSNFTELQIIWCGTNNLTKLKVTNCTALQELQCSFNNLSEIDLSGLNNLTTFVGGRQNLTFTLFENEDGDYVHSVLLNNPTFDNDVISYEDGVLKISGELVASTWFTVQTNKEGFELGGQMHFIYDNVPTYDSFSVQRINDLIANNGLEATPNAPETWNFAFWNNQIPKKITELYIDNKNLSGAANFSELFTLQVLNCSQNALTEINLTNCTGLKIMSCSYNNLNELNVSHCSEIQQLFCSNNNISELDISNCTELQELYCGYNLISELDVTNCTKLQNLAFYNNNLTEIDVTNCTSLQWLNCSYNNLTELDVTNCTEMQFFDCNNNQLTNIDLSGLNNLAYFVGSNQSKTLNLFETANGEYIYPISLNTPVFGNSAISYENGILKSTDNTVSLSSFTVQTGKTGYELSGTLNFIYDEMSEYHPLAIWRINNLIANNGLIATPNAPETWDFAIWNEETPKQILELHLSSKNLFGTVSFADLSNLEVLFCTQNSITGLDVTNCVNLYNLRTQSNNLHQLNLTNCTGLQMLDCSSNNLNELDLTNCSNLQYLYFTHNSLTTTDLSNCAELLEIECYNNALTELDLTNLNKLIFLNAVNQKVPLTLLKNEDGEYELSIMLNNPTFGNSAISYGNGILKSNDTTVESSSFTVQTNKEGFELSGTMNFTYEEVGIFKNSAAQSDFFIVYPNPAKNELVIKLNTRITVDYTVYNSTGQTILFGKLNDETKINIETLAKGVYYLTISDTTVKFFKY